jgi:transcriptional repressor NrdR
MKCPFCEAKDTKVLDSRNLQDGSTVRRRRKCESCDKRFTTYEHFEIDMPLVVKNDGRRENYNREKLSGGIEKACQKRPISTTQIEHVITNVEKAIMDISNKEIRSRDIGSLVMMYMKNLDPVAYVRFASVYMNFHDVDEFVKDIKRDESFINSSLVNQVDISQFQSEQ